MQATDENIRISQVCVLHTSVFPGILKLVRRVLKSLPSAACAQLLNYERRERSFLVIYVTGRAFFTCVLEAYRRSRDLNCSSLRMLDLVSKALQDPDLCKSVLAFKPAIAGSVNTNIALLRLCLRHSVTADWRAMTAHLIVTRPILKNGHVPIECLPDFVCQVEQVHLSDADRSHHIDFRNFTTDVFDVPSLLVVAARATETTKPVLIFAHSVPLLDVQYFDGFLRKRSAILSLNPLLD